MPKLLPTAHILALLIAVAPLCRAHGPLDETIAAVTAELAREPDRAELLLSRARLHAQHQDWPAAHADLDRAATLTPDKSKTSLLRGEVFFMAADDGKARTIFADLATGNPQMSAAHGSLARVLFAMGEFAPAAESYGRAIAASQQPEPMLYINQSSALGKASSPDEAIAALDAGIARLGPLVTLVVPALELDIAAKRYDAAIARLDAFAATQPRREMWLVRRAEILEKVGRNEDAAATWRDAKTAFLTLPENRQSAPQMVALRARIDAALSRAEKK